MLRSLSIGLIALTLLNGCSKPSGYSSRSDDAIIRGVNYVGVSVKNLDQATNFYQNTVNLQQVTDTKLGNETWLDHFSGRENTQASTRLMKSSNGQLRLMQFDQNSSAPTMQVYGPGIAHVCYQANQYTQAYQKFLKFGGKAIGDVDMVQLNPANPVFYSYSRDLDDNIVEIEHVDIEALNLPQPPKHEHRIRHVSLATPNIDRAVKFYSQLLEEKDPRRLGRWLSVSGEKVDKVSGENNSKLEFAFFQIRNIELEIIQYVSHPTEDLSTPRPIDAIGYNMIVFDVDDLDTAKTMLLNAGGKLEMDTQSIEDSDMFFGRDPDGNLLGFQRSAENSLYSAKNFANNGI